MDFKIEISKASHPNILRDETGERVEHRVSITHNGHQWNTFQLTISELRQLRHELSEYIWSLDENSRRKS